MSPLHRPFVIAVLAIAFALASTVDARAQRPNLFEGIWDLDREASTFGPDGGPRSQVRYYENRGDGVVLATFEGVDAEGDSTFTQYAAKHDGLPYPMVVTAGTLRQSIALTPLDTFASDWVIRVGDEVVSRGTSRISLDGRTYTVTTRDMATGEAEAVLVFERRPN